MEQLLTPEVLATVMSVLGAILTFVITRAAAAFTAATGISIEREHREALHSALMSGATAALEHGPQMGLVALKSKAIDHARKSVPDAIKALVPGDTVLDTLAERYAREAMRRMFGPDPDNTGAAALRR